MRGLLRYAVRLIAIVAVIALVGTVGSLAVAVALVDGPQSTPVEDVRVLAPASDTDDALDIVALGDSFMSGEGTGRYLEGTDVGSNRCHRSRLAYPVLLAERLAEDPVEGWDEDVHLEFAACSGAVTTNIGTTFSDPDARPLVAKQYTEQDLQIRTLERHPDADVVIVGVGGNDAGFSTAVLTCTGKRSTRNCADLAGPWLKVFGPFEDDETMADDSGAAMLPQKVRDVLDQARSTAPHARYYMTTYPNPFSAESCPALGMDETEVTFIRDVFLGNLNSWISYVAGVEGFEVIDLTDVFAGEGLCAHGDTHGAAMNPWKDQRNKGLALNPKAWMQGSVHPTARGHELIADAVERQVRAGLAGPAPNLEPQDVMGPVPPSPPPDQFTTIRGSFCLVQDGSLPCEIPGEPQAGTIQDIQQGPATPPTGAPDPPGDPVEPPGTASDPPVTGSPSPDVPTPPAPGTGGDGSEPPVPPPLFVQLRKNTCTEQADFANFVPRPSGPLVVTEAEPGSTACYALSTGRFREMQVNGEGDLEINSPDAVSGIGGNREVVYLSEAAGGWVWRLESPAPETPDSDFSEFEAWLGSWWATANLQELSRPRLILVAVASVFVLAAVVDATVLRWFRRRRRAASAG